jgi:hypothetical protein
MPQIKLIISLMSIVALIIIGVAVFLFTHLSGLNMTQGIVLVGIAIFGLILVIVIIFMVMKGMRIKK